MAEQFLPTALKAVALVVLAGGAVAAAYLARAAMRDDTRTGDDR